jgi:hypothetical protein
VVGRKNQYGSRSLRRTQVDALFYTLCETAKLAGVDPHSYLLRALYAAIVQPGAVTYPERPRERQLRASNTAPFQSVSERRRRAARNY